MPMQELRQSNFSRIPESSSSTQFPESDFTHITEPDTQIPESHLPHPISETCLLASSWQRQSSASRPVQRYRQNQLPKNVKYSHETQGKNWIQIMMGEVRGASGCLSNARGVAYHLDNDEIFLTVFEHDYVLACTSDRRHRAFYHVPSPRDVAISSDGQFVYIATNGFIKVNLAGELVKTVKSCSLGRFKSCHSIACHKEFTVLLSGHKGFRSVFVYDQFERELRHFGRRHLVNPTGMGISNDGTFYITDSDDRFIKVFQWNGHYKRDFLFTTEPNTFGQAVIDGDDFVCVGNMGTCSIDVYDQKRRRIARIGCREMRSQSGQLPSHLRLCFTPDGRLIVADCSMLATFLEHGSLA